MNPRLCVALSLWMLALAAAAADPGKVLRVALEQAESGFDPALFQDTYSSTISGEILEPMLRYDYLARPARLVPNTWRGCPRSRPTGAPSPSACSRESISLPTRHSAAACASSLPPTTSTASCGSTTRR